MADMDRFKVPALGGVVVELIGGGNAPAEGGSGLASVRLTEPASAVVASPFLVPFGWLVAIGPDDGTEIVWRLAKANDLQSGVRFVRAPWPYSVDSSELMDGIWTVGRIGWNGSPPEVWAELTSPAGVTIEGHLHSETVVLIETKRIRHTSAVIGDE